MVELNNRGGRFRGLVRPLSWAAGFAAALTAASAQAGPQGEQVVRGQAKFTRDGSHTLIEVSNNAVVQYDRFNIGADESVRFVQPGVSARVLNRIVGAEPTRIDGRLDANGRVYFVNPAGVIFGRNSIVNVGALYAAAGHLADEDFLSGTDRFTNLTGGVENFGRIKGSQVHLLGQYVANHGSIVAAEGLITMTSGDEIFIGEEDGHLMLRLKATSALAGGDAGDAAAGVTNTGTLDAAGGTVNLGAGDIFGVAIHQQGIVKAQRVNIDGGEGNVKVAGTIDARDTSTGGTGGQIDITAHNVDISGATIDASGESGGGSIRIGGDFHGLGPLPNALAVSLDGQTIIRADATGNGDGGRVIVWADDSLSHAASISVRGGEAGGDGGFAEVSSAGAMVYAGAFDGTAAQGEPGTLLIDPTDIIIRAGGGGNAGDGSSFTAAPGTLVLDPAAFGQSQGSVVLQATNSVIFESDTSLSGALVVQAGTSISINPFVDISTSFGKVHLEADSPHSPSGAADGIGSVALGANASIISGGDVTLIGTTFFLDSTSFISGSGRVIVSRPGTGALKVGTAADAHLDNSELSTLFASGGTQIGGATTAGSDGLGTGAVTLDQMPLFFSNAEFGSNDATLVSAAGIDDAGSGSGHVSTFGTVTVVANGPVGQNDLVNNADGLGVSASTIVLQGSSPNDMRISSHTFGGSTFIGSSALDGTGRLTIEHVGTGGMLVDNLVSQGDISLIALQGYVTEANFGSPGAITPGLLSIDAEEIGDSSSEASMNGSAGRLGLRGGAGGINMRLGDTHNTTDVSITAHGAPTFGFYDVSFTNEDFAGFDVSSGQLEAFASFFGQTNLTLISETMPVTFDPFTGVNVAGNLTLISQAGGIEGVAQMTPEINVGGNITLMGLSIGVLEQVVVTGDGSAADDKLKVHLTGSNTTTSRVATSGNDFADVLVVMQRTEPTLQLDLGAAHGLAISGGSGVSTVSQAVVDQAGLSEIMLLQSAATLRIDAPASDVRSALALRASDGISFGTADASGIALNMSSATGGLYLNADSNDDFVGGITGDIGDRVALNAAGTSPLRLYAGGSIGALAAPLQFANVTSVSARSETGGVYLADSSPTTMTVASDFAGVAGLPTLYGINTGGGDIVIARSGGVQLATFSELWADGGDIIVGATTVDTTGGYVGTHSGGKVEFTGSVSVVTGDVYATDFSFGGGGDIVLQGTGFVDTTGGELHTSDGGDIRITPDGDITTGDLNTIGSFGDGPVLAVITDENLPTMMLVPSVVDTSIGGFVDLISATGDIDATGGSILTTNGGGVTIIAPGNVLVNTIDTTEAGLSGGGQIYISGANVIASGDLLTAGGNLLDTFDGAVTIESTSGAIALQQINTANGNADGGPVTINAATSATLASIFTGGADGHIDITTQSGDLVFSNLLAESSAGGGNITANVAGRFGSLTSVVSTGAGGSVNVTASGNVEASSVSTLSGGSGGGNVALNSTAGLVHVLNDIVTGAGGGITINGAAGVTTASLISDSDSGTGSVTAQSALGSVSTGSIASGNHVTLAAGGGPVDQVSVNGGISAPGNVSLTAGDRVQVTGSTGGVGSTSPATLTATATTLDFVDVTTVGNQAYNGSLTARDNLVSTAGSIALNGNYNGAGSDALAPQTISAAVAITGANFFKADASGVDLLLSAPTITVNDIGANGATWSDIALDGSSIAAHHVFATGDINVGGQLDLGLKLHATGDVNAGSSNINFTGSNGYLLSDAGNISAGPLTTSANTALVVSTGSGAGSVNVGDIGTLASPFASVDLTTLNSAAISNVHTTDGHLLSAGNLTLGGQLRNSATNAIVISGNVTLAADSSIVSTISGGTGVQTSGSIDGPFNLSISAGTADVVVAGATDGLTSLNVDGLDVQLGSINVIGGDVVIDADVLNTGAIAAAQLSGAGGSVDITTRTGDLDAAQISADASLSLDAQGGAVVTGDLTVGGGVTLHGNSGVTAGNITASAGSIDLSTTAEDAIIATLSLTAGDALLISSGGSIDISGDALALTTISIAAGAGSLHNAIIDGDVDTNGALTITAGGLVQVTGVVGLGTPDTVAMTGAAIDIGEVTSIGDQTYTGPVNLRGDLTSTTGSIAFSSDVDMASQTGATIAAGHNISGNSFTTDMTGAPLTLSANTAGSGGMLSVGAIAATASPFGHVTLSGASVSVTSVEAIADIVSTAGLTTVGSTLHSTVGTITINGGLTGSGSLLNLTADTDNVSTGDITDAGGNLQLQVSGAAVDTGSIGSLAAPLRTVDIIASSSANVGSTFTREGQQFTASAITPGSTHHNSETGDITFDGPVASASATNITNDAPTGNITFTGTIDGMPALTVDAGAGNATFGGAIGAGGSFGSFTATGGTIELQGVNAGGAVNVTADSALNLGGDLTTTTGGITLTAGQINTPAFVTEISTIDGAITITGDLAAGAGVSVEAASGITIDGSIDAADALNLQSTAGAIEVTDAINAAGAVTVTTPGSFTAGGPVGDTVKPASIAVTATTITFGPHVVHSVGDQTYNGNLALDGSSLISDTGGINVTGNTTLTGQTAAMQSAGDIAILGELQGLLTDFTLEAGSANVSFGAPGSARSLTVTASNTTVNGMTTVGSQTYNSNVTSDNALSSASSGSITINGDLLLAGDTNITTQPGAGNRIDIAGDITGPFNLALSSSNVDLSTLSAAGGSIPGLTVASDTLVTLSGDVDVDTLDFSGITGSVSLLSDSSITSDSTVDFSSAAGIDSTDGAHDLSINAGAADILLPGVGVNSPLGIVTLNTSGGLTLSDNIRARALNAAGITGDVDLAGSVTINVTDGGLDLSNAAGINGTTSGSENLTISADAMGAKLPTIGNVTPLGSITVLTTGQTTLAGDVITNAAGAGDGSITFAGDLLLDSPGAHALRTGGGAIDLDGAHVLPGLAGSTEVTFDGHDVSLANVGGVESPFNVIRVESTGTLTLGGQLHANLIDTDLVTGATRLAADTFLFSSGDVNFAQGLGIDSTGGTWALTIDAGNGNIALGDTGATSPLRELSLVTTGQVGFFSTLVATELIQINPDGRGAVPSIATSGKVEGALTFIVQNPGGSFIMGQNEKLTVGGHLTINADNVSLGDLSVLGNIDVTADHVSIQRRPAGVNLTNSEIQQDPQVDIVSGGSITFRGRSSSEAAPAFTNIGDPKGAVPKFANPTGVGVGVPGEYSVTAFFNKLRFVDLFHNGALLDVVASPSPGGNPNSQRQPGAITADFQDALAGLHGAIADAAGTHRLHGVQLAELSDLSRSDLKQAGNTSAPIEGEADAANDLADGEGDPQRKASELGASNMPGLFDQGDRM